MIRNPNIIDLCWKTQNENSLFILHIFVHTSHNSQIRYTNKYEKGTWRLQTYTKANILQLSAAD